MDIWTIVVTIAGVISTLGATIALVIKSRGENKNAASNANTASENAKQALTDKIDARIAEQLKAAWAEIEGLKTRFKDMESRENRRTGAFTRILRAIAQQWPLDGHGPDLDPADISEIEETIPPSWIRKRHQASNPT